MGVLFEDKPSPKMCYVMDVMQKSVDDSVPIQLMLPRGAGKTSATEALLLYLLLYGLRKFVVIVSANARSATNILRDIWRVIQDTDTPLAQDFPEVCLPYALTGGATRRRQIYNGTSTDLQRNSTDLVFPRLKNADGTEMPTSGSVLTVRGITSGIRGLKRNALRPDCVLLDDLQTSATAGNPEQVDKIYQLIKSDIMNLSAKGKIGVICCATPIAEDDLTSVLKKDKGWRTLEFPYIIKFPTDFDKGEHSLWQHYFTLYDAELADRLTHEGSLDFYKNNRAKMDEGAELFSERFNPKDGHISGLQAIMDKLHLIGERAFFAEYEMKPVRLESALDITPDIVSSRQGSYNPLECPRNGLQFICASTDINASKWLTTVVMAFLRDGTARILWHKWTKCHIPQTLTPEEYGRELYEELSKLGKELRSLGIQINGWAVDCGGTSWKTVTTFVKNSRAICGIAAHAYAGKASHQFRPKVSSRLKEAVNRTVLCGDEEERKHRGQGTMYSYWDSDYYREKTLKGFLTEVGNLGSISFYRGTDHGKWAIQICGEKLMGKEENSTGDTVYEWREVGTDHDALDAIAQGLACHASMGFADTSTAKTSVCQVRRSTMARRMSSSRNRNVRFAR